MAVWELLRFCLKLFFFLIFWFLDFTFLVFISHFSAPTQPAGGLPEGREDEFPPKWRGRLTPDREGRRWRTHCRRGGRKERTLRSLFFSKKWETFFVGLVRLTEVNFSSVEWLSRLLPSVVRLSSASFWVERLGLLLLLVGAGSRKKHQPKARRGESTTTQRRRRPTSTTQQQRGKSSSTQRQGRRAAPPKRRGKKRNTTESW